MPTATTRHQHRHFKTLIVLVLAMTGSTLLLYWVAKLTPVIPLRATSSAGWSQILVRAATPTTTDGFYHVKVDAQGRVSTSSAWAARRSAEQSEGVIQVLVRSGSADGKVTPEQTRALAKVLDDLRRTYDIPANRVRVAQTPQLAGLGNSTEF
jgi:hypothetical protein